MTDVNHPRSGVALGMVPALLLSLCLNSVMSQLRPDYSDLPGKYCENRPDRSRCCGDRTDDCGVSLLGTLCYCDQFCDRGLSGDCCPDYFTLCLNETRAQIDKDCVYKGNSLRFGEIIMENCNPCVCAGSVDRPAMVCGTEPCLVEPALLARLAGDAAQLGWTAANHSRFWGRTLRSGLLQLLGTDRPSRLTLSRTFPVVKALHNEQLPAAFDARRWPAWSGLIGPVQDQGWCGASWAVSTAGTASDRFSIQSGRRVALSSQQLLDCAAASAAARGCRGGQVDRAWNHLRWRGVSSAECHRYQSGQTGLPGRCGVSGSGRVGSPPAACRQLYRMQPSYRIASREMDIRHEIFTSGPVQALLRVEPGFFVYRSGVYRTSQRGPVRAAYHSVRIIGWGEQTTYSASTLPYWLVANSWGTGWGEEGLFRIRRGTNEADIETFVVAAWARTHRQSVSEHQRTADGERGGDLTPPYDGEDRRRDPQETASLAKRGEDEPDSVEASGDDPEDRSVPAAGDATDQPVTPGGGETEHVLRTETGPMMHLVTSKDDNSDHLVTHAEEEKTDDLLIVDEKQTDSSTPEGKEIDNNENADEDGTDSLEKLKEDVTESTPTPDDLKPSGSKAAPEEDQTTLVSPADEDNIDQLVISDSERTEHPLVAKERTEQLTGESEQDGHVGMIDESQTDVPVTPEEETGQDITPDPKPGGWLDKVWSGWGK